jgi:hypothetical protein
MDFISKTGLGQWSLSGVVLGAGFVFPVLWSFGLLGITYFLYLVQPAELVKRVIIGSFVA